MTESTHKSVDGILWEKGTICNVKWAGARLRDVLLSLGVVGGNTTSTLHVCFASHVSACQDDDWYGASIPLDKVMDVDGDVLIAYEVRILLIISALLNLYRHLDEWPTAPTRSRLPIQNRRAWLLRCPLGEMARYNHCVYR